MDEILLEKQENDEWCLLQSIIFESEICIINSCTGKTKVIPIFEAYSYTYFPEHFCFHGKNSVFLNSGQKRGCKHSFPPPTPSHFCLRPCRLSILPLCK